MAIIPEVLPIAAGGTAATTAGTARTNLGLGTAAVEAVGTFAQVANNLSDVTAATARTNLGLAVGTDVQAFSTNLSSWAALTPLAGVVGVLSTTTSIDGTSTGATNLYTVPGGKTAVIIGAIIRLTTLNAIISVATAGIGTNGTQDNILPSTALTGLDVTNAAFCLLNSDAAFVVATATEVIQLGIDVAFVATTATLAVDLIGYLV